jgi:putative transposase
MTRPREVLPGRILLLTRRTTQRQHLLRPDAETNNAFTYCLAESADRHSIDVVFSQQMSNHHHTTLSDRHGHAIEFMEHFHKMVARSQNVLRGRTENFWSSQEPSVVHLADPETVLEKIAYSVANPVKAGLVDRSLEWPGIASYEALLEGKPLHAQRPKHFFRENGPMPPEVTLNFVIPPELGSRADFLRRLRRRVEQIEAEYRQQRAESGSHVLGRSKVLEQDWRKAATTPEPRHKLNPRIATSCASRRSLLIRLSKGFQAAYRLAREALVAKSPIPFPAGTYWLRRFAGVTVEAHVDSLSALSSESFIEPRGAFKNS